MSSWKRLALLAVLPTALQAATFKDVPKGHWAYGAIQNLVETGMIQGKGKNGKFEGQRAFTRFEMAVVLARYMEKLKVAKKGLTGTIEKTYPLLKKLATEFSAELDLLGVKHQDLLARVTSLETRADMHQSELQQLRAMVEENRRLLSGAGYKVSESVARAPEAPQVYRRSTPQPPSPRPTSAPAPTGPLFASAPGSGAPEVPDSLRLQNLRMRARGLLQGIPGKQTRRRPPKRRRAKKAPGLQLASAPAPAPRYAPQAPSYPPQAPAYRQPTYQAPAYRSAPAYPPQTYRAPPAYAPPTYRAPPQAHPAPRAQAPAAERGGDESLESSILDTIDRVRKGQMDVASAEAMGAEIEDQLEQRRSRRSKTYPLSERLFGPMGLGPPAGD